MSQESTCPVDWCSPGQPCPDLTVCPVHEGDACPIGCDFIPRRDAGLRADGTREQVPE